MQQFLRRIAFPFSLIYALVVLIRNFLYDNGFFKSISYKTPIVCVGNLSVGGTGKTPMIEYLIRLYEGRTVAVLSRGYKRKSSGFLLGSPESSVTDLGDEPYQLHKKFPDIFVAVDANRRNGIVELEKRVKPDIILLDDAFQHRKVKPKYSILLTTYNNLYVDDWYLPTGDLRDSKLEAGRAEMIIVTKCPEGLSLEKKTEVSQKLKPNPTQKVLFCSLVYNDVFKNPNSSLAPSDIKGVNTALVTGIASPEPLVSHLKNLGIDFQHFRYGDHHYFSDQEIQKFKDFEIILTTEKDFTRLESKLSNVFYLEIAHSFNEDDYETLRRTMIELI